MSLNPKQKRCLQANVARDRAEALLERVLKLKREAERQEAFRRFGGQHGQAATEQAFDKAIHSTLQIIESLNARLVKSSNEATRRS